MGRSPLPQLSGTMVQLQPLLTSFQAAASGLLQPVLPRGEETLSLPTRPPGAAGWSALSAQEA